MTPLDALIEQSRKARDQAGRLLAEERQQQVRGETQLRTLEQYRADYGARLQDAMNAGIDAARLGDYRRFIQALDSAIEQARQALRQHTERVDAGRDHWQQQQRRLASYDTLARRRAERARQREQRREQRDSDELAAHGKAHDSKETPWTSAH